MPDGFRLRLNAADGAKDDHGPIEDAKAPFHFDGKIHVPGRVNDMNLVVQPGAGGHRRRDRDPPLLLLRHPVHHGFAVMDLSHLVGLAGVKQDPFGDGGLTRIDVGNDSNISGSGQFRFRRHLFLPASPFLGARCDQFLVEVECAPDADMATNGVLLFSVDQDFHLLDFRHIDDQCVRQ